jgi:hypothetical protein
MEKIISVVNCFDLISQNKMEYSSRFDVALTVLEIRGSQKGANGQNFNF